MSILRKGSQVFFATWLGFPLQLITGIIVIRTLGAEGRGIIVVLSTAAAIFAMLGQLGTPSAGVFYARKGTFQLRSLLSAFLCLVVIECVVLLALWGPGASWLLETFLPETSIEMTTVAISLASVPFQMINAFALSLLLGLGESGAYGRISVGMSLFTLLLTVALVLIVPLGVIGALIAIVTPQVVGSVMLVTDILGRDASRDWKPSRQVLAALLSFGTRHYVGAVGSHLFKRGDNFIVAYFLGAGAVGYYSVAAVAYDAVLSIPRAVGTLLGGDAASRNLEGSAAIVAGTTRNVIWLMVSMAVTVGVGAIWLVPWIYGADFVLAVVPLQILVAASVLVGTTIGLQAFFFSIGRPGLYGTFTLVAGVANLALSLLLVPAFGIVGNAIATLLGSAVSVAMHLIWFRKIAGVRVLDLITPRSADFRGLLARVRAGFGTA